MDHCQGCGAVCNDGELGVCNGCYELICDVCLDYHICEQSEDEEPT